MPTTIPRINIRDLRRAVASVELEDGSVHDVQPFTGEAFQILTNAGAGDGVEQIEAVFRAVGLCIPTATPTQVNSLSLPQAQALVSAASGDVEGVMKLVPPNARETEATPGASPSAVEAPSTTIGSGV